MGMDDFVDEDEVGRLLLPDQQAVLNDPCFVS